MLRIGIIKALFELSPDINRRGFLYKENPQIVWGFRNRLVPKWY